MDALAKIVGVVVLGLGVIVVFVLLATIPTWLLWNWLMPTIFGLKPITLLQACGLLFLSGFLIKGSYSKK